MNVNFSKTHDIGLPGNAASSRNSLIEIILLVIVGALFVWFIILPKKAQVDAKKADLAKMQDEQSQVVDKLTALQKLSDILTAHPKEVSELDEAIPLDGKTLHLRALITTLAESVGVTVGTINVSGKGDALTAGNKILLANPFGVKRTAQKLSGSAFVIGSLNQIKAFLEKLETNGRIMDIVDLKIDSAPQGLFNLQVSLNAYYFAQ